jgi:hypothetical protein
VNLLTGGISGVHEAIVLGLLDHPALAEITSCGYESCKEYRDFVYNHSGFSAWEADAIEPYFGACRSILVGACGGGREVAAGSTCG